MIMLPSAQLPSTRRSVMSAATALHPVVTLSARELSRQIHAGTLSCREVMAAYLAHIGAHNPQVNAIVALRGWLYRSGLLRATRLPVPVLVVGNLGIGGAGKTPLTIALAQALRARGWRPGVVSRGYGRSDASPRSTWSAPTARPRWRGCRRRCSTRTAFAPGRTSRPTSPPGASGS